MSNITIINRIIDDGSIEKKKVFELEKNDVFQYRLLGQSTGINMDHCENIKTIFGIEFTGIELLKMKKQRKCSWRR